MSLTEGNNLGWKELNNFSVENRFKDTSFIRKFTELVTKS